jgi:hypothetical protein
LEGRVRAFKEVRKKLNRLGPEARAAGLAAYRNLVSYVDAQLARAAPAWVPRGAQLLAEVRASFDKELKDLRQRYNVLRLRASAGIEDLQREIELLYRERRAIVQRAKRRVRRLPGEYRLVGQLEVVELRRALEISIPAWLPAG